MAEPRPRRAIQDECARCGATPGNRCKTPSGVETRQPHIVSLEVDPAPAPTPEENDSHRMISREVTTGVRHGKLAKLAALDQEIDEETAQLEQEIQAGYYNRGIEAALLQSAIGLSMSGQRKSVFKGLNEGSTRKASKRRAKNRVARKSRRANRR